MNRILSIDVFRGVTMFLMIWVNDFWTLHKIPRWLKHALSGEDYLGFSDLIFPWFLFVMGMSIPYSFENRFKKGETEIRVCKHVLSRTIALLIMGLFHMNMEMYNHEHAIIAKPYFVIICTIAFFMIWNNFQSPDSNNQLISKILPVIGAIILGVMFLVYKGKDSSGFLIGFSIHWWGILGLIGWSYFISASSYLIFRRNIFGAIIAFCICIGLNILSSSGIPYNIFSWQSSDWIPGSGGLQALAFGGVIISLFLMKYNNRDNIKELYTILFGASILLFNLGLYLKQFFIISKISGTPTWILISLSTAILLYAIIHWIVDYKKVTIWYNTIKIAGTATLTCYLIPYFYNSFRTIMDIQLPLFITTGLIGLLKSILYSFIIITIAWIFKRMNIQVKI